MSSSELTALAVYHHELYDLQAMKVTNRLPESQLEYYDVIEHYMESRIVELEEVIEASY